MQRRRLAGNSLQQPGCIPEGVGALPCYLGSMERVSSGEQVRMAAWGCEEACSSGRFRPNNGKPLKSALSQSLSPRSTKADLLQPDAACEAAPDLPTPPASHGNSPE